MLILFFKNILDCLLLNVSKKLDGVKKRLEEQKNRYMLKY